MEGGDGMIAFKIAVGLLAAAILSAPTTDTVKAEEPSIYAGKFTVTAYCPCRQCCGNWSDGLTATGVPAGPGIVAVDPEFIPLGSTVIIDGTEYLAADTGGSIKGARIDICTASHQDAMDFGVQEKGVWVAQ